MNDDDQVNVEELAESRKQREAAQATADTKKAETEQAAAVGGEAVVEPKSPRQWVKHARKWLGAQSLMQPPRLPVLKKKPAAL